MSSRREPTGLRAPREGVAEKATIGFVMLPALYWALEFGLVRLGIDGAATLFVINQSVLPLLVSGAAYLLLRALLVPGRRVGLFWPVLVGIYFWGPTAAAIGLWLNGSRDAALNSVLQWLLMTLVFPITTVSMTVYGFSVFAPLLTALGVHAAEGWRRSDVL